jgi:Uma2 family endonuclease
MSASADDWLPRHRLTVEEYYRMAEVGLLAPEARVELIQGEVIDMVPIGSRHAAVVTLLSSRLIEATRDRAIITVQQPIRLDRHSEPQPDIAVVAMKPDYYCTGHPTASDVLLLIEISDSTLRYDREIKLPLYARHGVAEAWLLDLASHLILRHRDPSSAGYASTDVLIGDEAAPGLLPGAVIDLTLLRTLL